MIFLLVLGIVNCGLSYSIFGTGFSPGQMCSRDHHIILGDNHHVYSDEPDQNLYMKAVPIDPAPNMYHSYDASDDSHD